MKKVLVISYRFPPQLTTRSAQVARWVKHLPKFGWEPLVVCAEENSVYNTPIDLTMNSMVPSDTKVVRVKSFEPRVALALAARATPFLLSLPDHAIGWYRPAYKKSLALLKERSFDLIFSCAFARTSNLVGLKLKQETGLPWIAYFSDPWVDSLAEIRNPITRYINRRMERAVIRTADAVIFISEGMRQMVMKKYPRQWSEKSLVVSQCFDSELVASVNENEKKPASTKFTITFAGNLYGGLRNLVPLYQAIRSILDRHPDIYQSLTIQIVGKMGDAQRKLIDEFRIDNVISGVGTVPYLESLSYMARADVLLSFDPPSWGSSMLHPSKVAEYLGFKKPILAITPLDAGWVSVFRQIGGIVVSPYDIAGIEQAIMTLYQDYNQDKLPKYGYTDEDTKPYNAINTVAKLARIFDDVSRSTPKA